jgi:hypothetical protein
LPGYGPIADCVTLTRQMSQPLVASCNWPCNDKSIAVSLLIYLMFSSCH